jgi:CheY-like chemotaxis protein
MPGIDACHAAKNIINLPANAQTPSLPITANCSSDYRDLCVRHGMQGFLSKPVQTKELVQAVEKYLPSSYILVP